LPTWRAAFSDGARLPNDRPGFGVRYDEARMDYEPIDLA